MTFVLLGAPYQAKAETFTEEQKAELKTMLDAYLKENGELILKSVNSFQAKQLQEQQKAQAEKVKKFAADLKNDSSLPIAGNPEGDITVVEFFDYNCGYCRKALEEIEKLLAEDDQVKVVLIDMPILGPQSQEASKWSVAAANQGKYFEYHRAIMNHNGPKDISALKKLAKDVGLDVKELEKDKESIPVGNMIKANLDKARELGIQGTPGFMIEDEVARGFITAEQMKSIIKDIRG
ncbi:MAG: DsbA family protein [Pseudomonadota bacterium]